MFAQRAVTATTFFGLAALTLTGCSVLEAGSEAEEDQVSINSILGIDDGNWDEASQRAQEDLIQESIATCMAEEGWEYIPVVYPTTYYEYSTEDELEQINREGFGIAYWTLNQGQPDEFYEDPWADFEDPNWAIQEALTAGESEAYYEALYGSEEENRANETVEIDPVTGEEYYYSEGYGGGCQGEAYEAVYDQGNDLWSDEDFARAMDAFYEELYLRVEADPRLIKIEEEWLSCMRAAGYEYQSQEEYWDAGWNELQVRHDEIVGEDFWADPMEGWTEDEINDFYENATEAEMDAMWNRSYDLTDDQRSQLEALLADEIALATANFECSQDMYTESDAIYREIEAEFAEENRAELEALAAQHGSGA